MKHQTIESTPHHQYTYTPDHFCAPFPDATLEDSAAACISDDFDCQCEMIDDDGAVVDCKYGWVYNTTGLFTSAVTDVRELP